MKVKQSRCPYPPCGQVLNKRSPHMCPVHMAMLTKRVRENVVYEWARSGNDARDHDYLAAITSAIDYLGRKVTHEDDRRRSVRRP